MLTRPWGTDSAPYLIEFVPSSCSIKAEMQRHLRLRRTAGPRRRQARFVDWAEQQLIADHIAKVRPLPDGGAQKRVNARHRLNAAAKASRELSGVLGAAQGVLDDRLHAGERILDPVVELVDEKPLCPACLHLGRDVAEIANDAVATVWQHDAIGAPLVAFRSAQIAPLFNALRRDVGFSGLERAAKDFHDLVGIFLLPENMDDLVEVAADDAAGDVAEDRHGDGIDGADTEVGVHEINAQGRLIDERFELLGAMAQGDIRLPPHAGHAGMCLDACHQLGSAERLDE